MLPSVGPQKSVQGPGPRLHMPARAGPSLRPDNRKAHLVPVPSDHLLTLCSSLTHSHNHKMPAPASGLACLPQL